MKKTFFLAAILALLQLTPLRADEKRTVRLDNREHRKVTISLDQCNIFVELNKCEEKEDVRVTVSVENAFEDKILCLFNQAYSEKALRKMSVIYDKSFPGQRGERDTYCCKWLPEACILQPSSEPRALFILEDFMSTSCQLPIYIATAKELNLLVFKKDRIVLTERNIVTLEIVVELKPDETYVGLSKECDKLIEDIGNETFCTNEGHIGIPCETLTKTYGARIDSLKKEVKGVMETRGYRKSGKMYGMYSALAERLDTINLEKRVTASCGKDVVRDKHKCRYCSLTYEAIYRKLEGYYIDIHNGSKDKAQVMGDVNALHNCAVRNKKRSGGRNYKTRINTYYNKIKAL